MLIRLTNPQALDRLISYLEKDCGLVWPQLATREPFRDWKIRTIKEEMQSDIIFLEVNWAFNPETMDIECTVNSRPCRDILTDEEYLSEDDARSTSLPRPSKGAPWCARLIIWPCAAASAAPLRLRLSQLKASHSSPSIIFASCSKACCPPPDGTTYHFTPQGASTSRPGSPVGYLSHPATSSTSHPTAGENGTSM